MGRQKRGEQNGPGGNTLSFGRDNLCPGPLGSGQRRHQGIFLGKRRRRGPPSGSSGPGRRQPVSRTGLAAGQRQLCERQLRLRLQQPGRRGFVQAHRRRFAAGRSAGEPGPHTDRRTGLSGRPHCRSDAGERIRRPACGPEGQLYFQPGNALRAEMAGYGARVGQRSAASAERVYGPGRRPAGRACPGAGV